MMERLDYFKRLITGREKRIDKILKDIEKRPANQEELDSLPRLRKGELRIVQLQRLIVFIIFLLLVLYTFIQHERRKNLEHEADFALRYFETQNLPVEFRNSRYGDLQVRFVSPEEEVPLGVRDEINALVRNQQGFGRHPGLGARRELMATIDALFQNGLRYQVYPATDTTALGIITINCRNGRLSVQDEPILPGGEHRQFEDLPNFALKIESFNELTNQWRIRFCEKAAGEDFLCSEDTYTVNKSPAGQRQEHFLVKNPGWEGSYMVSIGFGEQGVEGRVWTVNARVTQFRLAN